MRSGNDLFDELVEAVLVGAWTLTDSAAASVGGLGQAVGRRVSSRVMSRGERPPTRKGSGSITGNGTPGVRHATDDRGSILSSRVLHDGDDGRRGRPPAQARRVDLRCDAAAVPSPDLSSLTLVHPLRLAGSIGRTRAPRPSTIDAAGDHCDGHCRSLPTNAPLFFIRNQLRDLHCLLSWHRLAPTSVTSGELGTGKKERWEKLPRVAGAWTRTLAASPRGVATSRPDEAVLPQCAATVMSLRHNLDHPCCSSVPHPVIAADAAAVDNDASPLFAVVRLLRLRPESPFERNRVGWKWRARRVARHSSSSGWWKRWWFALTVAFLLTTMPCAHGLLAPNMSVIAAQAVKDHMRNAHFTGEHPRRQTRFWQLYNHCSHGYVQTYYKTVNARGKHGSKCLIDFKVVSDTFGGRVRLQHALSGRYLCFNRRRRVTVRQDGASARCEFVEHLNDAGYTELESATTPGLFLGFNRKGRFQDPAHYSHRRRCFAYTKFSRDVPDDGGSRLVQCSGARLTPPVSATMTTTTTTTTRSPLYHRHHRSTSSDWRGASCAPRSSIK
uniref:Uncharacterized protein n=1 Tax=Plectus sambesii TaxID=2011161 RepID=A0A914W2H3_9BILA